MKKSEKVWQTLVNEAQELPSTITKSAYYKFLSNRIRKNGEAIGWSMIEKYGLLELVKLNPDQYAIEHSESDVSFLIKRLKERRPNSANIIAMFIRESLTVDGGLFVR